MKSLPVTTCALFEIYADNQSPITRVGVRVRKILNIDFGHHCAMRSYIGTLKRCVVLILVFEALYWKVFLNFKACFMFSTFLIYR